MHQETIASDANSPLHQIREKELEISGRVLSAKRHADEIVAEARKRAAELVSKAEEEGGAGAAGKEKAIRVDAEAQAETLRAAAAVEAEALGARIDSNRDEAVQVVLGVVTSI